jgi:hypothetical protein
MAESLVPDHAILIPMTPAFSRSAAAPTGVFFIFIETWRRWHEIGALASWPTILEDWLLGGFLLLAAALGRRDTGRGPLHLAAAWGAATGIMFGSFFGQLVDLGSVDPSGIPSASVVAVKGIVFSVCLLGLVGALRQPAPEPDGR